MKPHRSSERSEGNTEGRSGIGRNYKFVDSFAALNYTKKRKHTQAGVQAFLESKGYLDPRND